MSKAALSKVGKPKVVPVEIDGETVYVKSMTGAQRKQFMLVANEEREKGGNIGDAEVAAFGLCEQDGAPSFASYEEAVAFLSDLDGGVLSKIAVGVLQASGLSGEPEEEEKKS